MIDTVSASATEISIEDVEELRRLPTLDRAAALSHLVYMETIKRPDVDWSTMLEDKWKDLNSRTQIFNKQLIETWADNEQLFDLWISTVKEMARLRREERHPSSELTGQAAGAPCSARSGPRS